jgi:branched-chain amino acid transport system permease protein
MLFLQYLINGIAFGCIYALIAVSFVIIYRGTKVLNFAQGEFMVLGSYVSIIFLISFNVPFLLAIIAAILINALLGVLLEVSILRKFIGESTFTVVMVTIGLASVFKGAIGLIFGHDIKKLELHFENSTLQFGGVTITTLQIASIIATFVVLIALLGFYRYSKWGIAMRGAASDQDTSQLMGVNINHVNKLTWSISAVISVIAGIVLVSTSFLQPTQASFALKAFPAIVLGGLDSIPGAVIGGLVLGIIESLAGGFLGPILGGNVKDITAYVFLLVILIFMPYGLFGTKEIERV